MRLSTFSLLTIVIASGSTAMGCGSGPTDGGGGDASAPASVVVSVEAQCSALNPCGGDVEGTWDYTSGCAEVERVGRPWGP
jgi:hypothetical protein